MVEQINQGTMRADFFYRINVITISVPPLRTRREDIPLLIDHILSLYGEGQKGSRLPGKILETLYTYDWPGNVRQLQNVLQRYLTLGRMDIHDEIYASRQAGLGNIAEQNPQNNDHHLLQAVEGFERQYIATILQRHQWHREHAAQALGITPRTLRRKIQKYQLHEMDSAIE
jgi:DNA-binding NtrC family response regulator